jgi:hypothetical protein
MNCPGDTVCQLKEHKGYDTCDRAGRCQVEEDRQARVAARDRTPYPQFCSQPFVCSIDGRCHRDPCCID